MNSNLKTALIIGGILLVLVIVGSLFSGGWGWRGGGGMMGGFGSEWLMVVIRVLFWVLVIWGIIALTRGVRHGSGTHSHSEHMESALEVLKRRYASGEISKEEYEEKKKDLA